MLNFNSRNMIMKKLYTVVTVFLFAILAGCSDFLEQDNKSNVPELITITHQLGLKVCVMLLMVH